MVALVTTAQAVEQRVDLPNGGFVTVDPDYDLPGVTPVENAGLVRWYDQNSSLVRAVHGSTVNDRVGSGGVTVIGNDGFLISSPSWDNGAVVDAGALTFSEVLWSITPGVSGAVSATNSRVGSATGDLVISGDVLLVNTGSFVVCCPQWDNGAATDAGAVITGGLFGGTDPFVGLVSASNAMVGTSANDQVGSGGVFQPFPEAPPVVHSPLWDNGGVVNAGAVTFLFLEVIPNSQYGVVSATNSLVGSSANDQIGSGGIVAIPGMGLPMVHSPLWDNGGAVNAGAVTTLIPPGYPGATIGVVTSSNSLVGSSTNDQIGSGGIIPIHEGYFMVHSPMWDKAGVADAGAVTLISMGSAGAVSAANSLVGSSAGDQVGSGGGGLFDEVGIVVSSPLWDNGNAANAGAVTILSLPWFGFPANGVVSTTNSLVGSSAEDRVGSGGVAALGAISIYVLSPLWDNGSAANAGAVTILSAPWAGYVSSGVVSASNSLVGSSADDQVGSGGVTPQGNMGLLVSSPLWDNGGAADAGAVTMLLSPTLVPGMSHGAVSAANSLVGSSAGDQVGSGGLTAIEDAGIVVHSPLWDNTGAVDAGAVTLLTFPWLGPPFSTGALSAANSLVGSSPGDQVGSGGITVVGSIGIVVSSPLWDNGSAANAGAVTLMPSPLAGLPANGVVSATNSLVGSSAEDRVSSGGVVIVEGQAIVVRSPLWDNGSAANAGAVTMLMPMWVGYPPTVGAVSAANSVVGSSAEDQVGSGGIVVLKDTAILVRSPAWDNGGAANAGAVTLLNPPWLGLPTVGTVSAANSWVGASANDQVGSGGIEMLMPGLLAIHSPEWSSGAGAVTLGWPPYGTSNGVVSAANSLVGATANDKIGSGGITRVYDGSYLVHSPLWDNGSASEAGALSLIFAPWMGVSSVGVVSAANSLVGSSTNDQVGGTEVLVLEGSGTFVVHTPFWDNGSAVDAGAVTLGLVNWEDQRFHGTISAANSLVGTSANDQVGSGGITRLGTSSIVIHSPLWNNGAAADAGAITLAGVVGLYPPLAGIVSASNSLVGTFSNDQVGGEEILVLSGGATSEPHAALPFVVHTPLWDNGSATDAGAVTFVPPGIPVIGAISASNSLVGSTANDQIGSGGIVPFGTSSFVVLSPVWDNGSLVDAGAATMGPGFYFGSFTGAVSATNSNVGSTAYDQVGSGGAKVVGTHACLVHSPLWDHRTAADAGAVTWYDEMGFFSPGPLTGSNSLRGTHPDDRIGSGGITVQANPLVTIYSPNWCYGAGAITSISESMGGFIGGVLNQYNSILGAENAEPEFALQRPAGNDVAMNSVHDFGTAILGSSGSLTFTIKNKGLDDLLMFPSGPNMHVYITGQDAAQFSLPSYPPSRLVTGDSASMTVNFKPTSAGIKAATLHILHGEHPSTDFTISLTGSGEMIPVTTWRQTHFGSSANAGSGADNADFDRDGIPNLVEYALGLHPAQNSAGQFPQAIRESGYFSMTFTEPAWTSGVTYGAEWSTSMAGGSWQPAADYGTGPQHVFKIHMLGHSKIFMRLKITPTPVP